MPSDAFLFARIAAGDSMHIAATRASTDRFIRTVWEHAGSSYQSLEMRDARGSLVFRLAADSDVATANGDDTLPPMVQPITQTGSRRLLGSVVLRPLGRAVLPAQLSGLAFGRSGYVLVTDSSAKRVLYDSRRPANSASVIEVLGPIAAAELAAARGGGRVVQYGERDSVRLATADVAEGPRWMVLSSAAISEFTDGLDGTRVLDLALVIAIAVGVALAFTILIGRTTRSLEQLTVVAGAVGHGDLAPRLPVASDDEIGTLTSAFDHMLGRIRKMMREIEVSRQLAVLGEFSAQLSHEVRNPLTSLKLNLQGLSRDVRRGSLPAQAGPPLDTCLREVNRLDGVVRGVLELARPRTTVRAACSVHALLDRVVDVHAARLAAAGITVLRQLDASGDIVCGDAEQLVGLFTNLVVNAIDAQPQGGRLMLRTRSNGTHLDVEVADDGPGPPAELADRIFRPFVSGKPTGTGLGLPMALNAARDHEGTLELISPLAGFVGATFRVTLPLA